MKQFERKAAVRLGAIISTTRIFDAPVLTNPSNGVSITIKDPGGSIVISSQAMTLSVTGKYFYDWQTTIVMDTGIYTAEITADDTDFDGFKTVAFELV